MSAVLSAVDKTRISRVLMAEQLTQPIPGSLRLTEGVKHRKYLRFEIASGQSEGRDVIRALLSHHLNAVIDDDVATDENGTEMKNGICHVWIRLSVERKAGALWKHSELTPPSKIRPV